MSTESFPSSDDIPDELQHDEIPSPSSTHKRSISSSLLARVPFLRPSQDHRADDGSLGKVHERPDPRENGAVAAAPLPKKSRSRKGSLRKAALLGGRAFRMERKASGLDNVVTPRVELHVARADGSVTTALSPSSDDIATPRASYEYGREVYNSSTFRRANIQSSEESLPFPAPGRRSTFREMSTTDEDEGPHATESNGVGIMNNEQSYFNLDPGGVRRRTSKRSKSPLATMPVETVSQVEEWDYAETEWWGWIILVVTWIVFVVGMGSCFGVWSWAWDVGETPYAPPELEDDPTLPIVGYYPALIILTGVMAWVWVIVAWVGMKYFKHAKIPG